MTEETPGWARVPSSWRIAAAFGLLAAATATMALHVLPAAEIGLKPRPSVCVLKLSTGIPCLACRGTRAALALGRGDLPAALRFNPLATLFLLTAVAGSGLVAISGRWPRLPRWAAPWPVLAWSALGLALAANWAYVIAAGG